MVFWTALLSLPAVGVVLSCVQADDDAGLALGLSLDRGTASRDEPVQFTVELTNTAGVPLTVHRWRQTDHTLEVKDRVGNVWPMKTCYRYRAPSRRDFYTLLPRESVGFRWATHMRDDYRLAPGRYRMAAVYHNAPLSASYGRRDVRDLAVTEHLPVWRGSNVRSDDVALRVTRGEATREQPASTRRAAARPKGISASLTLERPVAREDGRLEFALKLTNRTAEPVTLRRWRPGGDAVHVRDVAGELLPLRVDRTQLPAKRADFYTLRPEEWIVFRSSVSLSDYGVKPGESRLAVVYDTRPLIVESPQRNDLSVTEKLRAWEGTSVRSNEVTFRVE